MLLRRRAVIVASLGAILAPVATYLAAIAYVWVACPRPTMEDLLVWPLLAVASFAVLIYAVVGAGIGLASEYLVQRTGAVAGMFLSGPLAGLSGFTTEWWMLSNSPHVNRPLGAVLVGGFWAITALSAVALGARRRSGA